MKIKFRILAALFVPALLCAGLAGCSPAETDTAEETETVSADASEQEVAMESITTWMTNGIDKVTEEQTIGENPVYTMDIWMSKNEAEGCQVSFRAPKRYGSIAFTCTKQPDGAPALDMFKVHTLPAGGKHYPDPLSPFSGKLTLLKDTTASVYLRFTADTEMTAGDYTYEFALDVSGTVQQTYTVNVHVWDFALPDTLSCATAVGLYKHYIAAMHPGVSGEELDQLYVNYYNTLLEYKVSAYDLPYDILDERADAYMSNPLVTSFRVPTCDDDDARLVQIYEKLCSNPVWLDKAYFYPLDEPTSKEMLDQLAVLCERLQRLAPEVYICTPFFRNIDYNADTDQITFMTGKTTLWCPKSYMYITSNIYTEAQMQKYPLFGERMAERKAAGDKVWWYVCWEPGDPYNNMFVDQRGIQNRMLFWQQYANDVDGFLYWGANYWDRTNGTLDPWQDMATVKNLSETVYGDGSLLYNGTPVNIDGACASFRLAQIRDGIEDFEMFCMAEELFGREWVDEMIARVTPSLTRYSNDTDNFISVRKAVGDAIAEKLGK
ncbi:MAG: DUF4091 domain-containing protein [Clostridia bacterium]|nr:DUF4091 domain-containing protein [Clostridia bacterium]